MLGQGNEPAVAAALVVVALEIMLHWHILDIREPDKESRWHTPGAGFDHLELFNSDIHAVGEVCLAHTLCPSEMAYPPGNTDVWVFGQRGTRYLKHFLLRNSYDALAVRMQVEIGSRPAAARATASPISARLSGRG